MGVNLREITKKREIEISDLSNKILAVDSYNQLYQFITTIRSRDGSPLMDSKGQVTSHLIGVFSRATNLMQSNIKLCYVFDGKVPDLKKKELEKRKEAKLSAQKLYEKAKESGDEEMMRKYGGRFARLNEDMVEEAKKLITYLGMPLVQAPSEGEAQAAFMTKQGHAYAVSSQDFDSVLFGATRVVRNLSISQKKKVAGKLVYETVKPEEIITEEVLKELEISQDKLIAVGMLVGTDYNNGGIKGLGPKKALQLVKKHDDLDKIFSEAKWSENSDVEWQEIFELFKNMPYNDAYSLKWSEIDEDKITKLLVDEHDFSQERVESTLAKLSKRDKKQQGLKKWF